jgi:hypothetical protein
VWSDQLGGGGHQQQETYDHQPYRTQGLLPEDTDNEVEPGIEPLASELLF